MGHNLSCRRSSREHDFFAAVQAGKIVAVAASFAVEPSLFHLTTIYDRLFVLHITASNSLPKVLAMLLDQIKQPISLTGTNKCPGSTPLHLAARVGSLDCVRKLLAWGRICFKEIHLSGIHVEGHVWAQYGMITEFMYHFRLCWWSFDVNAQYGAGSGRQDGLLGYKDTGQPMSGEFSMIVVQVNNLLEDQSQVESGSLSLHDSGLHGTFVGVYDGHGGPETVRYANDHLFNNIKRFTSEQQVMSVDVIRKAFQATGDGFSFYGDQIVALQTSNCSHCLLLSSWHNL